VRTSATEECRPSGCRLFKSFEDALPFAEEWDRHLARTGGSIYLTFHWCRIWWKHYGSGRRLRLFIDFSGEEVSGILPLFIEDVGVFPFRARVARMIGSHNPPRAIQLGGLPSTNSVMVAHSASVMFGTDRCDVISLGPLSRDGSVDAIGGPDKRGRSSRWTISSAGVFTSIELPGDFPAFLALLSRNERSKFKRESQTLHDTLKVSFDTAPTGGSLASDFPDFMEMHARRWNRTGRPGHFKAWPGAAEFNLEVAHHHASSGRLRFFRMLLDGRPIYYMYALRFGARYHCILDARGEEPGVGNIGLGRVGLIETIRQAIAEGAGEIETGPSSYEYKGRMGARESPLVRLRLISPRLASLAKVALLRGLFGIWTILYYKIWYRRMQPRFPALLNRPVSSLWIDLNF
jgi:CelD/BcsL family acetyltransferase involved in cellulose biosynthesis